MFLRFSKAWYGDIAREPGDIDWVLRDEELCYRRNVIRERITDFLELVRKTEIGGVLIRNRKIQDESISMGEEYWKLIGRRLTFPWQAERIASGTVQMDFAFDDDMRGSPLWMAIATPSGAPTYVLSVGKEESLAWKLLWLQRDANRSHQTGKKPRGKDLYDAVLLAEDTPLYPWVEGTAMDW